ncbi:ribokinase [bacterium]|nr:ribokinase [bacterium]
MTAHIAILGVFVADTAYRADRAPKMGETIMGNSFALGPGGKGSNQAVAAARAGGKTHFISKLGRDVFAEMAFAIWSDAGVKPAVTQHDDGYTGAAYIFVEEATGNNAIIICPGIAATISPADIEAQSSLISEASVFVTQLEQPIDAAICALEIAKAGGATTILNPAPATELPPEIFPLCDYVTPNESEAESLTGIAVNDVASAERAGEAFLELGVGTALITLGEGGAVLRSADAMFHIPAFSAGPVVETTGAGDAFNGGFAVALSEGMSGEDAVRFASATAGISVTRPGTAPSMPLRAEIDALLKS